MPHSASRIAASLPASDKLDKNHLTAEETNKTINAE